VNPVVALALAVAAAIGYGVSSVLQGVAARRSEGTWQTLRQPLYLAGLAVDLVAWLASLAAARTLPIYLVQTVLAGSLVVTVLVARFALAVRLRAVDAAAIVVTVAALGVIALSAGAQHPVHLSTAVRTGTLAAAVLLAGAGWLASRAESPGTCAVLAGLAFGGATLAARAATLSLDPLLPALAVFGLTGMLLYADALEHGQVGPVTSLLWIAEVVVPSALGVIVLGDSVRPGWVLPALLAGAATLAAAVVLATAPAQSA
jgi:hypothetical protein